MIKKSFIFGLIIAALSIFLAKQTFAAGTYAPYGEAPIYGGGPSFVQAGNILVDKKVSHPKTGNFVDNLSVKDDKFAPDQNVTFQITLTNTGGTKISKINVKDIFPQFVNFVKGTGSFDKKTKTLAFSIDDLNPNESKTITINGKVVSKNNLAQNKSVNCVVNQVTAVNADNKSQTSQDNAQLCIQKELVAPTTKGGLKVLPETGAEIFSLLALLPTGLAGIFLRKQTLKYKNQEA